MQNGQWFEFARVDNVHIIQGSQYLSFDESYSDKEQRKILCLMLCEASRFDKIFG